MTKINPNQIYKSAPLAPRGSGAEISAEESTALIGMVSKELGQSSAELFQRRLREHVGDGSTYTMKSEILQGLKVIYDKLSSAEMSSSDKSLIFLKLQERIENCTPGFHDGVNGIVDGFFAAKDLDALLFRVRQDIVARMATRLTDEVHANNRCFTIAATNGYGVRALNSEDIHIGSLSDVTIQAELEQTFLKELTPLNLIRRLEEQLRGQLSGIGYVGLHADGYGHTELEQMDSQLELLFGFASEVERLKKVKKEIASVQAQRKALLDEARQSLEETRKNQLLTFITGQDQLFKAKNTAFFTEKPEIKSRFDEIKAQYSALGLTELNTELNSATKSYRNAFYLQANEEAPMTELNWTHLRALLWQGIKQQAYFSLEPQEQACLDTLMNSAASREERQDAITQFFQMNPTADDVLALLNLTQDLSEREAIIHAYLAQGVPDERSIDFLHYTSAPAIKSAILTQIVPLLKSKPLMYRLKFLSGLEKEDIEFLQNTGLFDDVNQVGKYGRTPLHWAAAGGHTVIAAQLLKFPGINVNQADVYGMTPLHEAAVKGHAAIVAQLLKVPGIDVNQANRYYGDTPLHVAAVKGHAAIVAQLLKVPGIDVNQANYHGDTPLHAAAENGHTAIVVELLRAPGIDVNQANRYGKTPFRWIYEKTSEVIVERLLQASLGITNQADESVRTPFPFVEHGITVIIERLLKNMHSKNITTNMSSSEQLAALLASLRSLSRPLVIKMFCKQFQDDFSRHIKTEHDLANLLVKLPPDLRQKTYQALQAYPPEQLKRCLTSSRHTDLIQYIESLIRREQNNFNFFSKYLKTDLLHKLSAALWLQGALADGNGYDPQGYEQHHFALKNGQLKRIFEEMNQLRMGAGIGHD